MKKVSIIIPAYNTESYISACISSVINQTYKNIEIIIINDGSTDGTLKEIQKFSNIYNQIKVIDQKNKGVSAVRNLGIQLAQGDFICFIDSDDWIDIDTIEICMKKILEKNADLCFFPYLSEFQDRSELRSLFSSDKYFEREDCLNLQRILIGPIASEMRIPQRLDSYGSSAMKLYKKELLRGISFQDLTLIGSGEDVLFNIEVFQRVKKAVYINKPFYHYRKNVNMSVSSTYRPNLLLQWCNLFKLISQYTNSNDTKTALSNRIALSLFGLGLSFCSAPIPKSEKIRKIRECLEHPLYVKAFSQLDYSYFPIYWRLFYLCGKYKITYGVYFFSKIIQKIRNR